MLTNPDPQASTLNSWKEIAHYLDRGVRTVQRWERELRLPIHRIGSGSRAPVYAVVSELKFWMATAAVIDKSIPLPRTVHDPNSNKGKDRPAMRVHQLVQAVAESSVRQQRQAEALQKNILALRSRFPPRKSK
jgi:hypothetical protein